MNSDKDAERQGPPIRFTVRTKAKPNRPGTWNSTVVSVLDGGVEVGSYERNYPSHCETTFCPFMVGDRWFALYSRDYTATRIMSLPDCKDIGGEDGDSFGFCPVELYVPAYRLVSYDMTHTHRAGEKVEPYVQRHSSTVWDAAGIREYEEVIRREASGEVPRQRSENHAISDWTWCPFGFVAGCIWGDDSSWKIEHIDLSGAAAGKIVRTERLGYIELPPKMDLRDAIDMDSWEPDFDLVGVIHRQQFRLTGKEGV